MSQYMLKEKIIFGHLFLMGERISKNDLIHNMSKGLAHVIIPLLLISIRGKVGLPSTLYIVG